MLDHEYMNNFRIVIASLPDRKNCVCEIYYKHNEWAEISQEGDQVMIQFYPPIDDYWEFPIEIALDVLQKAKKKFLEE